MSFRRVRMMIMLRIPENKYRLAQRLLCGPAALVLCHHTHPTNTQLWLGEEALNHYSSPPAYTKNRNKAPGSREGRIPA